MTGTCEGNRLESILPEDDFIISFYEEDATNAGSPEADPFAQKTVTGLSRTDSGLDQDNGFPIYKYDAFLSSAVLLDKDPLYFIRIYDDITTGHSWDWTISLPGDGYFAYLDGGWKEQTSKNLAFELTTDPVPEPGTMLLVGAGLMALVGMRKKLVKK
jgi:hypothetical protein